MQVRRTLVIAVLSLLDALHPLPIPRSPKTGNPKAQGPHLQCTSG